MEVYTRCFHEFMLMLMIEFFLSVFLKKEAPGRAG